jgi:hypothetical protein
MLYQEKSGTPAKFFSFNAKTNFVTNTFVSIKEWMLFVNSDAVGTQNDGWPTSKAVFCTCHKKCLKWLSLAETRTGCRYFITFKVYSNCLFMAAPNTISWIRVAETLNAFDIRREKKNV